MLRIVMTGVDRVLLYIYISLEIWTNVGNPHLLIPNNYYGSCHSYDLLLTQPFDFYYNFLYNFFDQLTNFN